jgi:hypothetical protein
MIGLILVAMLLGGTYFMTRTRRALDVEDYPEIPLIKIEVFQGQIIGTLDLAAWKTLPGPKKKEALNEAAKRLIAQGQMKRTVFVDDRGVVVIWSNGAGNRLDTAPRIMSP